MGIITQKRTVAENYSTSEISTRSHQETRQTAFGRSRLIGNITSQKEFFILEFLRFPQKWLL